MKTTELKELIGNIISDAQSELLSAGEFLKIVYPAEIEKYQPRHPVGEFLVTLHSIQYGKSKNTASIVQDKDVKLSVYTAVKYNEKGKAPEEYIDFLESVLSGIMMSSNRGDKMIYPQEIKFIKEENKYWWYECVFVCPLMNMKEMRIIN